MRAHVDDRGVLPVVVDQPHRFFKAAGIGQFFGVGHIIAFAHAAKLCVQHIVGAAVDEDEIRLLIRGNRLADMRGNVSAVVFRRAHHRAVRGVIVTVHPVLFTEHLSKTAVVVARALHDAVAEAGDGLAFEQAAQPQLREKSVKLCGGDRSVGIDLVAAVGHKVAVVGDGVQVGIGGAQVADGVRASLFVTERVDQRLCDESACDSAADRAVVIRTDDTALQREGKDGVFISGIDRGRVAGHDHQRIQPLGGGELLGIDVLTIPVLFHADAVAVEILHAVFTVEACDRSSVAEAVSGLADGDDPVDGRAVLIVLMIGTHRAHEPAWVLRLQGVGVDPAGFDIVVDIVRIYDIVADQRPVVVTQMLAVQSVGDRVGLTLPPDRMKDKVVIHTGNDRRCGIGVQLSVSLVIRVKMIFFIHTADSVGAGLAVGDLSIGIGGVVYGRKPRPDSVFEIIDAVGIGIVDGVPSQDGAVRTVFTHGDLRRLTGDDAFA